MSAIEPRPLWLKYYTFEILFQNDLLYVSGWKLYVKMFFVKCTHVTLPKSLAHVFFFFFFNLVMPLPAVIS